MNEETASSFFTGIQCQYENDLKEGYEYFWDDICGTYAISNEDTRLLKADKVKKNKIAFMLAQRKVRGFNIPIKIVRQLPEDSEQINQNFIYETIDSLLSDYPFTPLDVIENAFINISRCVSHPSDFINMTAEKCWIIHAYDIGSRMYILNQLESRGLIELKGGQTNESSSFCIAVGGWQYLANLNNTIGFDSSQAFIAMWFDKSMDKYFADGIYKAVKEDCGYECKRIDLQEHNNKICDEIISEIRKSKFVIADFSGNRGGVYFEAGYAAGIGIPVIWCVHEGHLNDVHFDTRQYNHITYKSAEELRGRLTNRINATII